VEIALAENPNLKARGGVFADPGYLICGAAITRMSTMISTSHATQTTCNDPRWTKLQARDKAADGTFCYGVKTTGVYCRPSCPSRTPKPENVEMFADASAARAGGYRACKRCNPDGLSIDAENAALVEKACRLIETADHVPSLGELARAVELSSGYFHRVFKATTGLTPLDYVKAKRAERVRAGLGQNQSITETVYGAGFNSSGRFYETAPLLLGMTPSKYRKGGADEDIRFAVGQSVLGAILVAASHKGIASILIGEDPNALVEELQDMFPRANLIGGDAEFEQFVALVVGQIEAPAGKFDFPLDVRGTAFQQRVWKALTRIPAGKTVSYSDIARKLGEPHSTRAVAGACAANKIAIAIPCHRVVRNDGALSGYRWGVERKAKLLEREKALASA
jgi:AraC family transcriptional regulator of adaptative response/methylated-DNA-[protein]-cysteine methyltransferase